MIRTLRRAESAGVTWIDVTAPSREDLIELGEAHGLHHMSVEDVLDPAHLPKFERIDEAVFVILRAFAPDREGTAVQDMTRKVAVYTRGNVLITIHRREVPVIGRLERHDPLTHAHGTCSPSCLMVALVHEVLNSYDQPLQAAETTLDRFDAAVFDRETMTPPLRAIHRLKGQVSLIRRLLWLTIGVVQKLSSPADRAGPLFQDLRESAETSHFYADRILESANDLLSTHLAVASHRTNQVVRILTLFSAFFLPLTFLAGVYGMNFAWMPELRVQYGYPAVLVLMSAIAAAVYFWFRRRGWLRRTSED